MRAQTLACCAAALFIAVGPRSVYAQGGDDANGEAKQRYERALVLYEEGAYDAALVELKRAHQLRPSNTLMYNIALVHLALHDFASAFTALRTYLRDGDGALSPQRKAEVLARLEELSARIAEVTVEVDVDGADILIDHQPVATSPRGAPLLVNSGSPLLTVRHPDFPPQHRALNVAGGDAVTVFMQLRSGAPWAAVPASRSAAGAASASAGPGQAASGAVAESKRHAEPAATRVRATPAAPQDSGAGSKAWIGWGVTGLLAAGAGVAGLYAAASNRDLRDKREATGWDPEGLSGDANRLRALSLATDGLLVGALVAGSLSLWWTLQDGDPRQPGNASSGGLRLGVGFHGAQVHARY